MLVAVPLLASLALSALHGARLPRATVHLITAAAHRCMASTAFLSGVCCLTFPHDSNSVQLQSLLNIRTRHGALDLFNSILKDQWYDFSTYLPLYPSEVITRCIPKEGV